MTKQVLTAMAIALLSHQALADEFHGTGYSLTLPAGWTAASKAELQETNDTEKSQHGQESDSDAIFFGPADTVAACVDVSPSLWDDPVTSRDLSHLRDGIINGLALSGDAPRLVSCGMVQVKGRDYVLLKVDNVHTLTGETVRDWWLFGSAGGKSYTFTFRVPASEAGVHEPAFDQIIQSVTLESGLLGWFFDLSMKVRIFIVVMLVNGIVGLVRWIIRKRRPLT